MGKENANLVVVKYFLHVIKDHNLYGIFNKSFCRVRKSSNTDVNPFGKFENVYDLAAKLGEFSSRNSNRRSSDKYQNITNMVNHLLHFFLERGGVNPQKLGKYGQKIFNLSCSKIYGDSFTKEMEEINSKHGVPNPRTDKEAWLIDMFLRKKSVGEFNGEYSDFIRYVQNSTNMPYDEFIELNKNHDNDEFYENADDSDEENYEHYDEDEDEEDENW